MELTARKYKFIEEFIKLTNLKKIEQLEDVLHAELHESKEIVAHTTKGEPLTRAQYVSRIEEADKAIDRGEYISHEEVKRTVRSWKK